MKRKTPLIFFLLTLLFAVSESLADVSLESAIRKQYIDYSTPDHVAFKFLLLKLAGMEKNGRDTTGVTLCLTKIFYQLIR